MKIKVKFEYEESSYEGYLSPLGDTKIPTEYMVVLNFQWRGTLIVKEGQWKFDRDYYGLDSIAPILGQYIIQFYE